MPISLFSWKRSTHLFSILNSTLFLYVLSLPSLWAACFSCKYQDLFLFQKDMRWGCVGPDPSYMRICSSAVRGCAVGLWQEPNSCSWPQGRLQSFYKDLLCLLTPWKLMGLPHLNQPSACPATSLSWAMMHWVCAETWHSITLQQYI